MRVLIIDDNEKDVKGIRDYCEDNSWNCKITDFDECYKEILLFNPDVVVLDWTKNPGDDSGSDVLKSVWTNGYRPTVIFSGIIDEFSIAEEYRNSKLVEVYKKGDEEPVLNFLSKYVEYYGALSSFREEMGKSIIEAFRMLAPLQNSSLKYPGEKVIKYLLSKRAVSFFDFQESEHKLPPWATYLYPPVLKKNLSVCDIIRKTGDDNDYSKTGMFDEYRVILTPSCDLYATDERKPKVENVLCAKCIELNKFTGSTALSSRAKKNLKADINAGYKVNMVPLPPLGKILPNLIVDMKSLETVNLEKIALGIVEYESEPDKFEYLRVCSVDSPFREQIVWAYLHNSCRPGVPDRDTDEWVDMIETELKTEEGEE